MSSKENDELIADFMGIDKVMPHDHQGVYYFNKLWDALIPVLEKIEEIPTVYSVEIYIGSTFRIISDETFETPLFNTEDSMLQAVYDTVVEFLQWRDNAKT